MAATAVYAVHEGFWTNLSEGPVRGATLTLSKRGGAYLIAFLALFVHMSGSSLWRLFSFILFRVRATRTSDVKSVLSQSAVQQQAVLRNGSSAVAALTTLVVAALRSKQRRKFFALICWALFNSIAVITAGVLSSKVANKRSEVLLQPTICGRWWSDNIGAGLLSLDSEKRFYEVSLQSQALHGLQTMSNQFASLCYADVNPKDSCLWFARKPITWTSSLGSGCPFDEAICRGNTTFSIDSGWIDSDYHLGINGAEEDRMRVRFQNSCAPLKRDGYFTTYNTSNLSPLDFVDFPFVSKFLAGAGPDSELGAFLYGPNWNWRNATFVYSNASQIPSFAQKYAGYDLSVQYDDDCPGNVYSTCDKIFNPIQALQKKEKTITLGFLTTAQKYCDPVTDPWFDAQVCEDIPDLIPGGKTLLECRPDYPVSALGCAGDITMCVHHSGKCVKLRASGKTFSYDYLTGKPNSTEVLELTARQAAIAGRIQSAIYKSSYAEIIQNIGPDDMLVAAVSGGACSPALPDDQWTKEITNWFSTMLINVQLYNTQFVTGWQYPKINQYVTPPPADEAWMCNAQIVWSPLYACFSVLGIVLILLLGGILLVLRLSVPYIVHKLRPLPNQCCATSWNDLNLVEMASEAYEKHKQHSADASPVEGSFDETDFDKTDTLRVKEKEISVG